MEMQQQKPEAKIGFFGKKPEPKKQPSVDVNNLVNSLSNRVRMIEDTNSNLRKKLSLIEQNMISENKKVNTEIRAFTSEINDVKKELADVKNKILLIIKELKLSAKKEDVDILSKYINLWEPINFVTQKEVEKIIDRKLETFKYTKS